MRTIELLNKVKTIKNSNYNRKWYKENRNRRNARKCNNRNLLFF